MTSNRNELAVILPEEWQVLTQQANALVASGFLPQSVNSPQKAIAIMTLGRELGIGAWAALSSINVIQGKPTISPQLMLALINDSKQLEDMTIRDDGDACTVTLKRRGRTPHTAAFSMQDAAAMGLSNKDNWKKQPAIMRQWRAVAACARVVFPDVILGLYTPEELGANVVADELGNMTIVEVKREEPRQLPQGDEPATTTDKPSASVSGAGVRTSAEHPLDRTARIIEETLEADLVGPTHEFPPNVYVCDALVVNVTKTARQYILKVVRSTTRITLTEYPNLPELFLGETPVVALQHGEYPIDWLVTADKTANGWDVQNVETALVAE